MPFENLANNYATTLNGTITDSATSLTLTSATGAPTAPFRIIIGSEIIIVGARSTTSCTSCVRGAEGTTAVAHTNGDAITHIVTADFLKYLGTTVVVKAADESVTSSTTLQNDDELKWTVGANEVWAFDILLFVSSGNQAASDLKFNFTLPASATIATIAQTLDTGATNINGTQFFYIQYRDLTSDLVAGVCASGTAAYSPVRMSGIVRTAGTAGTVQLQWAQNTSQGTATTIKADSFIRATRTA